jgi:hypothetical protein
MRRQKATSKRWYLFTDLHSVTSQKKNIFFVSIRTDIYERYFKCKEVYAVFLSIKTTIHLKTEVQSAT